MEDRLFLKVYKIPEIKGNGNIIRIDSKAFRKIAELQKQTGLSAKHIASEMICFAADKVEIMEI